jgi:hypothetical protein
MASSKKREDQSLRDIVIKIVNARKKQTRISPSWVATESMGKLEATTRDRRLKPLFYQAANLQMRQIARDVLRDLFETEIKEKIQHELWPDLQARYPIAHPEGDEPNYAKLEDLSEEDWIYNVNRMEREISSKQDHLDALIAWGEKRGFRLAA